MNEITQLETGFAAMRREDIAKIRGIREALKEELVANPDAEVEIPCEQHLHAGFYSRTIFIPKDTVAVGVTILKDTQLVISGHVLMNDGTHVVEIEGYRVLECKAGRAQIARTLKDTYMTMSFATDAKTVREAEDEFTDEPEQLLTRTKCQG